MYTKYYQDGSEKKSLRNLDIEGKLFKINLNSMFCKHVEELKGFVVESTSPLILVLCIAGNFLTSSLSVSFPVTIFARGVRYVTIQLKWDLWVLKAPTSAL